jgi:cysteine desulfurase family protein
MMEAMARFNDSVGANPGRSGHSLSIEAARVVYDARELAAKVLGASDPLSIIFTKNATEAINCILLGLLKSGDHVVASAMEHNSVMRPLRFLERQGVEVSIAPCSPAGELDPADAMAAVKSNTSAIVVTHASNVTGTLLPVEALARMARERGIVFILDASQTAGSIPLDVERTGIDILCFTGHKSLLGPQGTGGFYIRKGLDRRVLPLMRGGTGSVSEFEEQPDFLPDRFESGTPNAIGLAGLAAGMRFVLDSGVERIRQKEAALTALFLEGAADIPGMILYGLQDVGRRTAVVSFNIREASPSTVAFELDEQSGVLCRPGLHCAPAAHRTLGTFPGGTVRFSFGYSNTEEDVRLGLEALAAITGVRRHLGQQSHGRLAAPGLPAHKSATPSKKGIADRKGEQ